MRELVTVPRGSAYALARARHRWARGIRTTPETAKRFRCLGCHQWTHNDDGGAEDGPACLCCSACALPLLKKADAEKEKRTNVEH